MASSTTTITIRLGLLACTSSAKGYSVTVFPDVIVDKLLLVVAVIDDPLTRAVVDAWDPSFSPKLKRNTKPKLVIYY